MCRTKINMRETFSKTQKLIALSKSNRVCAHCGKPLDIYNMTVDHCIPLSKGGLNHDSNLVALCEDCNKDKSNSVYRPSDYYRFVVPYQMNNLEKAFQDYIDSNSWFDIQTFFPMDRIIIPNYRPLMKFCNDFEPKALNRFFAEYSTKAKKVGNYYFDRLRFRDADEVIDYIDEHDETFFNQGESFEDNKEFIEFYLKNGAAFTLRKGENEKLSGVFIFSLECLSLNNEVTFGVKVQNITDLTKKDYFWLYAYLEKFIIQGIAKENGFSHIVMVNTDTKDIPYYGFGHIAATIDADKPELITHYRCITFDRKGRLTDGTKNEKELPDEVKAGTDYYNKFFEISCVTQEKIDESVNEHLNLIKDIENPCLHYGLGTLLKRVIQAN